MPGSTKKTTRTRTTRRKTRTTRRWKPGRYQFGRAALSFGRFLTSGSELPRLTPISQLSFGSRKLGRLRVPTVVLISAGARSGRVPLGYAQGDRTEGFGYANRDNRTAPDRQGLRIHPRRRWNRAL